MKKNYLLLLIFLVLGAGTAWYLHTNDDSTQSTTLGWDRKFAVEDINEVQKVFIAKRTGETTTLTRNGDHWLANDVKASDNVVENVLEVVSDVTLHHVPPQTGLEKIVKDMATLGIKVEVYGKNDELLKAYYVGGLSPDGRLTYFIMEGAEQPMAVEIPQMEGQLRTRFEIKGDTWRDRHIFDYEIDDIQSVSIEYPKQRNKSFTLTKEGSGFTINPFYNNVPPISGTIENGMVEGFLVGFESKMAESFDSEYMYKDSVRATIPFSTISLTDKKGKKKTVTFYPYYKRDAATGVRKTDVVSRYFADVDQTDWLLVQHRVFQDVFWSYDSFFSQSDVVTDKHLD